MTAIEKAAIYGRVSTEEQKDSGTSLDSQESRAREYADHKNHNYRVLDHLVIKEDWTGTDLDRPGLKKLLTEAERDSLDVLIVYTPDRFNRPKNGRK